MEIESVPCYFELRRCKVSRNSFGIPTVELCLIFAYVRIREIFDIREILANVAI